MGPRVTVSEGVPSIAGRFIDGGLEMFVRDATAQRTRLLVLLPIAVLVGLGVLVGLAPPVRNFLTSRRDRRDRRPFQSCQPIPAVLLAFVVVYSIAIVVSGKTAGSSVDLRIVTPIFIPTVVALAWLATPALAFARGIRGWPRALVSVVVIGILVGTASSAYLFAQTSWRSGRAARGYAADTLASSPLARAVVAHTTANSIVTTNSPWALYSATRHQPIFPTPRLYPSASLAPATTARLAAAACTQPVFYAWFPYGRRPTIGLGGGLRLSIVEQVGDGVLYRIHTPPSACHRVGR
jgi:hypothetical protein